MEEDGLIRAVKQQNRRKIYVQSKIGNELMNLEVARLKELIDNAERYDYK